MGLFSKKEYDVLELPFYLDDMGDKDENAEALCIDFVFYGMYQEKQMRFQITFQYYNENQYEEMMRFLTQYERKTAIRIKVNKKKIQDFHVDLEDMALKLSNSEINKFERICWGAFE